MHSMEKVYATTRRPKWHYPAAVPVPKILHLPHRPPARRKAAQKPAPSRTAAPRERKGKLEALFEQERSFSKGVVVPIVVLSGGEGGGGEREEKRRERVEEREGFEEEKWRFQAEMLRAECNLLRMEKEIAVRKMERRGSQLTRILKSAAQTLITLQKEVSEGKDVSLILEEEINDLLEKLDKLQMRSRRKDVVARNCSNFDKQVNILSKQLDRFGGISDREMCLKDIQQEIQEASLSIKPSSQEDESFDSARDSNVEILRRKMEGMSNSRLLEKVEEEYGSMLFTATSSAPSSKRMDFSGTCLSLQQSCEEMTFPKQNGCSGHCKAIVRRIVEQVRVETEQWSQMQEMLGQVRDEIEELQASRDFWEDRALDADYEIQSLQSLVKEWRQKAITSEEKADELQEQVLFLHGEVERLKRGKQRDSMRPRNHPPATQQVAQIETEKRVLVCHSKENCHISHYSSEHELSNGRRKVQGIRSPLLDIQNSLPLLFSHRSNAM